jgi:hypothetical protein
MDENSLQFYVQKTKKIVRIYVRAQESLANTYASHLLFKSRDRAEEVF